MCGSPAQQLHSFSLIFIRVQTPSRTLYSQMVLGLEPLLTPRPLSKIAARNFDLLSKSNTCSATNWVCYPLYGKWQVMEARPA